MEVIYDPNAQQGQTTYMPQQAQYNPQQQYDPQQQPMAPPPQQQPVAQPVQQQQYQQPQQVPQQQPMPQPVPQQQQGGWPQQAPQQPQQGGWPQQPATQPTQQQQYQQPPQGQPQGGNPVMKLQCTRKQMERMNLLMMDGYINNVRVTNAPDGSVTRVGFLLAWESFVYENQQQVFNPDGTPATRDVRFAMTAWGAIAQAMAQLPVGTPVRVWASANRWNAGRQGEPANWQTDFRINRFEVL